MSKIFYGIILVLLLTTIILVLLLTTINVNAQEEYNYLIYQDGANFIALNGETQNQDFKSTDKYTVIQSAMDNTTEGVIYLKNIEIPDWKNRLIFKEGKTVISQYKGTTTYYGLFGHTPNPDLTSNHQVLRFQAVQNDSKPILEWRSANNKPIAWIVAHDMLFENNTYKEHEHISIETVKSDLFTIITRLEIKYGCDWCDIAVNKASMYFESGSKTALAWGFRNQRGTGAWYDPINKEMKLTNNGSTQLIIGQTFVRAFSDQQLPTIKPAKIGNGSIYMGTDGTLRCFPDGITERFCGNGTVVE